MLRAGSEIAAIALFVLAVCGWAWGLARPECAATTKRADRLAIATESSP